jgi:two-component system response regulator AtoC
LAGKPGEIPQMAGMVGASRCMREVFHTIEKIAQHKASVMISGESGTGKELVARAIHDLGPRRNKNFVAVNCGAIPGNLLESELFGHRRGAFTDAVRDKPGLFEIADGGTLFLDEIGELPLNLQVKLLRAIQEEEIRRIGDTSTIKVNVRLIAATLRDLSRDVAAGRFREDLFYRLNVVPVCLPPLRERRDDIPYLVEHFVRKHAGKHNDEITGVSEEAMALLRDHSWPGNIRELENTIERAMVLCDAPLMGGHLFADKIGQTIRAPSAPAPDPNPRGLSIKKATRAVEVELIRKALEVTGGNRPNAAKLLDISYRNLLYKIKEYGI